MFLPIERTHKHLNRILTSPSDVSLESLHKAYSLILRLRSQLLGVIYEQEHFGATVNKTTLAQNLSGGKVQNNVVTLRIDEPLPALKELTADLHEHWLELIHTAIAKAAQEQPLPYFPKAFVFIEVITPRGTDNARLWDTSNRAVNLILNNLKGIFFEDDNLEHMAFGVAGSWGEKGATILHVLDWNRLQPVLHELSERP